jgi:hypothetical protein
MTLVQQQTTNVASIRLLVVLTTFCQNCFLAGAVNFVIKIVVRFLSLPVF